MNEGDLTRARGGAPVEPAAGQGSAAASAPSFEKAMARLEEIVAQLESGELPLDVSLRLFEEGVGLSRRAADLLHQAQRKVEALTRTADGTLGVAPFPVDEEE